MRLDYQGITFTYHNGALPAPAEPVSEQPPLPAGGVGTEILNSRLMRAVKWWIGECRCKEKAREWDARGIEWCESHVEDELLPALREASRRFRVPWSEDVARRVVNAAISRAKRKARRRSP